MTDDAETKKKAEDEKAREVLRAELKEAKRWGKKYRYLWSCATHGTAWTIPSLSAAAGILSRFDDFGSISLPVVATVLSAIVVVISSVQMSVGFHRKWASYRRAQTEARLMEIDLGMGTSPDEIRDRLARVYRMHDDEVIGDTPRASRKHSHPDIDET
ncbi:MAG: hypothetical protein WD073_01540 [Xanthobacteraceae bacterium]